MLKRNLVALLASASLLSGCKSEETPSLFRLTERMNPKSEEERKALNLMSMQDKGPMYNIIEYKTGDYDGYQIEASTRESKLKHKVWHGEKKWSILRVFDYQGDKIIAKIEAVDSDAEGEGLFAIYPQSCIVPQDHPFEKYTPEKMREIYNLIMKEETVNP